MTRHDNNPQRPGVRSAAKQELSELKRIAPVPEEFIRKLEDLHVPKWAQRAILSSIAELSVPSSQISPREIAKILGRFMNHIENAVDMCALEGRYGNTPPAGIADGLRSIINSIEDRYNERLKVYDHLFDYRPDKHDDLIVGELAGLASCLTRIEDEWKDFVRGPMP